MDIEALRMRLTPKKPKSNPLRAHVKRLRKALEDGDDSAIEDALVAIMDEYYEAAESEGEDEDE